MFSETKLLMYGMNHQSFQRAITTPMFTLVSIKPADTRAQSFQFGSIAILSTSPRNTDVNNEEQFICCVSMTTSRIMFSIFLLRLLIMDTLRNVVNFSFLAAIFTATVIESDSRLFVHYNWRSNVIGFHTLFQRAYFCLPELEDYSSVFINPDSRLPIFIKIKERSSLSRLTLHPTSGLHLQEH